MDWVESLKPTAGRILLFIALMAGVNLLLILTTGVFDSRILVGFPLGFWPVGSFMGVAGAAPYPTVEFSWVGFLVDMLFWYVASCAIIAMLFVERKK